LIEEGHFKGEIDLLSLDVDGIDYYLFESIKVVSPRVVVLEFNHLLGYEDSLTIPYDENFVAEFSKEGTDYAGASLLAFIKLAKKKGYYFVGTNRFATNAFFIRTDIRHPRLEERTDLSIYFKHPRALFGMTKRRARIDMKKWIKV
jgi:hypothetical protein